MKTRILIALLPLMGACSHEARRVDCEKHLTAINQPTPVVKSATAPTPETKPEAP
jgi:hypothetical protein